MIDCQKFYETLQKAGLEFYAGVPDSLLKNFCFYVDDVLPPANHIIAANEGAAVGLAAGYHMATGKIPVIYLQNSGLGNTINPLLSLVDPEVYSIPMLMIIGWRGEPGVKDEPQHKKQGKVMIDMIKSMGVPFEILDANTADLDAKVQHAVSVMREQNCPFVFAMREGSFGDYVLKGGEKNTYSLTRESAIEEVLNAVQPKDAVICTTGKASRELYELRKKRNENERADFLVVGGMGHASQIALGVALQKPNQKVFCLDGDGSVIMHMGALTTIGRLAPKNYVHIMVNNGAHESVGGQSTGAFSVDWAAIAKACGYKATFLAEDQASLKDVSKKLAQSEGPLFVEIRTTQGSRKDLGRPKSTPIENKKQFMQALK